MDRTRITYRAAVALLALGVVACGDGRDASGAPKMTRFRVDGTRFAVPAANVRSISQEPPGFVRINDPDSPIEIAFHAGLQGKTDGRGAPLLLSVNDGAYPQIVYRRTARGTLVVCRTGVSAPNAGCGVPVSFRGATWTVLFPEQRAAEADALRRRAEQLLLSHSG